MYTFKLLLCVVLISRALCENKYSRSANENNKEEVNFRTLEKPFRMNKLNLLWVKAQQRLTEPKLKSLYSDLMIHDKEEITYKRFKSDGGDKEGLKEAELRRKLTNIMSAYGLLEHFDDNAPPRHKDHPGFNSAIDDHINKSIFKDKKLNQLWTKAETSGFTSEELSALKEEFQHHQDKIDQYYQLLTDMDNAKKEGYHNAINEEDLVKFNEIDEQTNEITKDYLNHANMVREKHRDLRDGYDKLQRVTATGPNNREFIEPKVQGLWRIAVQANFTVDELASLKETPLNWDDYKSTVKIMRKKLLNLQVELQHYESRLLKLRHLQVDHVSNFEKHRSKVAGAGEKINHFEDQEQTIKKHSRKVEKMHSDIESRILGRHSEL